MTNRPRLVRSRDKVWLGVCGGLADFFGWPARTVRALFGVAALFTGGFPALVAYVELAFAMPKPMKFNLDDFREQ